ncbi:MAG: heparan-alpha-glucosaminide N-acetyltransferase [Devosia sp.]
MVTSRRQSIDVYRGTALLAMAAYHAAWDLNYYRLISVGIGVDPLWIWFQRAIAGSFLLLVGASLVLAHGNGVRWGLFWRREVVLVAAAAAVSLGTWFAFGPALAYFGILHAIALFSLLALPFLFAPIWLTCAASAGAVLASLWTTEAFDPPWLNWIGFFRTTPETADLVPVFPWFGVVLAGVAGMRLLRDRPVFNWANAAWPLRAAGFIGRWSLLFYLLHQPILFGIVTPIANWLNAAEQTRLESFLQSCRQSCDPPNGAQFCTAYCACSLDMTVRDNLWNAVNADPRSLDQQASVNHMTALCTALNN